MDLDGPPIECLDCKERSIKKRDARTFDRLAETFSGKTVLITGATGFLGQVLVEKLLRKVDNIKLILLVRFKKNLEGFERVIRMLEGPLFATLRASKNFDDILEKIDVVEGDTALKLLGLSREDRQTCQSAEIIVHAAATVRFDEGLKRAVLLNTRGTKCMVDLAKQCKNLKLFIHFSTAYCHPEQKVLEEKLYSPPADPYDVINLIENLDDATMNTMEQKLLGAFPNTYAYSKALAETIVADAGTEIPIMILRPSVVIPILQDPLPGWTANINGPVGLLIGAGKGVIRTMYGNADGYADFVPADCAINVMMAATWDFLKNGYHRKVINLTTSAEIRMTWQEVLDIGKSLVWSEVPLDNVVWYPGGSMTSYRWLHKFRALLFHWLPALLVDVLLYCIGQKPIFTKVHKRINKGFDVFEYYTNNQWEFKSDHSQRLRMKLSPYERKCYKMDTEGFDVIDYFSKCLWAARRYILKEKDEDVPRARRHMKLMWTLDMVMHTVINILILKWLWDKFQPLEQVWTLDMILQLVANGILVNWMLEQFQPIMK